MVSLGVRAQEASTNSDVSARCQAMRDVACVQLTLLHAGTMVLPRSPITSAWTGSEDMTEEERAEVDASLLPPG